MSSGAAAAARPGSVAVAAIDLGATSGRVMLGLVSGGSGVGGADAGDGLAGAAGQPRIELVEALRFQNLLGDHDGHLVWDLDALWAQIREGLREAGNMARARGLDGIDSIGVDSWAVDYVCVGPDAGGAGSGQRIGDAIAYRDSRTDGAAEQVARSVSPQRQFALTGIAQQPFNTIYQLSVDERVRNLPDGSSVLLLPDAIGDLLTGSRRTERTNASTTGLLDVSSGDWSDELLDAVGVDRSLLAPFVAPGEQVGPVRSDLAEELGTGQVPVIAVGSHDTASAVAAVPAAGASPVCYISSGTWSLVGLELDRAIPTEQAREAGFTNEGGIDDTVRFLENVMGMWLVSESLRQWDEQGLGLTLTDVLDAAADEPAGRFLIDATDPVFLPPGAMADRIVENARPTVATSSSSPRSDGPAVPAEGHGPEAATDSDPAARPGTPGQIVRCILDSLALAYRDAITRACELASVPLPERVHVVGGGSRNRLLNQLTADALGIEVVAGPVEATALGNIAVQARSLGAIDPGEDAVRAAIRNSVDLETFTPGR
jgi:rhamnulokinase